jgi:hypothetical protein
MVDAALAYADRDYDVLPLNGKVPLTRRGFYDATVDPVVIREWWEEWPEANIGLRPPPLAIIFDIDPRNGGSLAALGDYPRTRTARTGSGGWHVWFAARGKFRSSLLGAEGVDIKTGNGFVVVPPSIHPATGDRYRWEIGGPVAPLPEHLVDRVVKRPRQRSYTVGQPMTGAQLAGVLRTMEDALVDRNKTLYWCACRLVERGAGAEEFTELEMAALGTGLTEDEVSRTVESAITGGTR